MHRAKKREQQQIMLQQIKSHRDFIMYANRYSFRFYYNSHTENPVNGTSRRINHDQPIAAKSLPNTSRKFELNDFSVKSVCLYYYLRLHSFIVIDGVVVACLSHLSRVALVAFISTC